MRTKEERRIVIKEKVKDYQGQIKFFRDLINSLKRELDFMNGHYDKTWEEEYAKGDKGE